MKLYTLYHGDEIVGVGTMDDLAELLGVSLSTIQWYATPSARKRGNTFAVFCGRV